jgi:hypothetical protein
MSCCPAAEIYQEVRDLVYQGASEQELQVQKMGEL